LPTSKSCITIPPSVSGALEYALDLCLGTNEKLSGGGPSSMVVTLTQSSELLELSKVSRSDRPTKQGGRSWMPTGS